MSRLETIRKLLEASPQDAFLRYSLGMELLAAEQPAAALEQFRQVMAIDPDYLAAYQQAAKALQALKDRTAAADMARRGLAVAEKKGDAHAADRLRTLVSALET